MNYKQYVFELLKKLEINHSYKGCEYIVSGIDFINSQHKYVIPDSEMIYAHISKAYHLSPVAVENSMRNVIQSIWADKKNPDFMCEIFGKHNFIKRPCNIEFLMLLYNYVKYHTNL